MFNNRKDPLIDSVKKVMEENELRRQAELDLNEELGIASKRALPHEHHANYDALLEQKIAEALHPNQQKLDVHEPEKDKLTSQDFKLLRAKKGIKEAIGDKEGTAGTLRKNGKPFVPDTLANSPFMQASPDKAPMPPERPKDLDKQAPTPPARPKDLNEISRDLARRVIRKASDEKEMGYSKKDRSKAVVMAGKKAYSIPSEPKIRATNEETIEENHVLYTHPKADIKVVRKGKGSKEGAAIEVHKGGKKVASGDYDHGADAFFVNVGGKGQKSFDSAKDIANHFHGMSEQFQIDEVSVDKLKAYVAKRAPERYSTPKGEKAQAKHARSQGMVDKANARIDKDDEKKTGKKVFRSNSPLYDYDEETHISGDNISEMAPKGAKYERMVKHIKDKYSKDDKLSDKEKSIAYATAWKSKNMKEGLTAEQVMAEIRKNLGEAKMKKIEEGPLDKTGDDNEIANPIAPGSSQFKGIGSTAQSGQMNEPKPLSVIKQSPPNVSNLPDRKSDTASNTPDTSSAPKPTTPNVSNLPKQSTTSDAGEKPTTSSNRAAEMGNDSRSQAKPNVDKNVPTGDAPAAGAAALTKQTPRPATPSAAKPAPAAKDDIWNDSMIQRTGEGGTETAADFNRNQDLYKQRMAAGGQRPAPEAPKPATPSASRPAAPRPATPSAGSSSPTGSSTIRGDGGTSSTSQNGGSAMPSGASGNAALRAAKRDGDGTTSDTFNRFQSNKPGTTSDTFNRLQSNKPGTYTRASQTPSNEVGSSANDTVGTSTNQNRTPASKFIAGPTKRPTSALNTRNNISVAESFTDTIMKVLKG